MQKDEIRKSTIVNRKRKSKPYKEFSKRIEDRILARFL